MAARFVKVLAFLVADAVATCDEVKARLDAAAERQEVAGTPWLPTQVQEVVELVLDC